MIDPSKKSLYPRDWPHDIEKRKGSAAGTLGTPWYHRPWIEFLKKKSAKPLRTYRKKKAGEQRDMERGIRMGIKSVRRRPFFESHWLVLLSLL